MLRYCEYPLLRAYQGCNNGDVHGLLQSKGCKLEALGCILINEAEYPENFMVAKRFWDVCCQSSSSFLHPFLVALLYDFISSQDIQRVRVAKVWSPNLMACENYLGCCRHYFTPSYLVQELFARFQGDLYAKTEVQLEQSSKVAASTTCLDKKCLAIAVKVSLDFLFAIMFTSFSWWPSRALYIAWSHLWHWSRSFCMVINMVWILPKSNLLLQGIVFHWIVR